MPRLGTWLAEWLGSVEPNIAPNTHKSYTNYIENHIGPALGSSKLDKLTARDLQSFFDARLKLLSPQSVPHIRTVLRQSLDRAVGQGLIVRNPGRLTDAPRRERKQEPTFLNDEQLARFLEAIEGDGLEALYVLALATGLRQAEHLGLVWEDLDLEHGELQVRLQLQRVDGKLQRVKTKTNDQPTQRCSATRSRGSLARSPRAPSSKVRSHPWPASFSSPQPTGRRSSLAMRCAHSKRCCVEQACPR